MTMADKATKSSKATVPQRVVNPVDPPWPAAGPISGSSDGRAVGEAPSDHPEPDDEG